MTAPDAQLAAEESFLEGLRRRVAWQSDAAARLRAQAVEPAREVDVLDLRQLLELVRARPDAQRHQEWLAFLSELHELAEPDGRLPESLGRLVRVVLADLL